MTEIGHEEGVDLAPLLNDLSWVRTDVWAESPAVRLTIRRHEGGLPLPLTARQWIDTEWVCGLACEAEILKETTASPLFPDLPRLWRGRWRVEKAAVLRKILSPAVIV
jgi:hypothetical protein